jgi:capsular polysaccharide transport system permease protein
MTTKPRARKFRIRRPAGSAAPHEGTGASPSSAAAAAPPAPPPAEDGFASAPFPGSAAHDRLQAAEQSPEPPREPEPATEEPQQTEPDPAPQTTEEEIAAIRAEGLTGRQLRMARRISQKHGLSPDSDFDAVRLLRKRGIDPFARGSKLELVVHDGQKPPAASGTAGGAVAPAARGGQALPAETVPGAPQPAPKPPNAEERAAEIMKVQRDIARRRRKKLVLLATRLAFFVLLPTLLVAYYYFRVATPMYATNTEFVIQKAEGGGAGPGALGGLLGGTGFATVQESITVQAYLESREAMLRLDEELGFRAHFSDPSIDPLNRLASDATVEDMYDIYRRNLQIGYDPTEGLIRMEVAAADPQTSQAFSEALIRYAEERVDEMSSRLREDQMAGARESFEEAEDRVLEAQSRVLDLQEQRGVLSTEAEVSTVFGQIQNFETQLQEERLRLDELMSVPRPNETRVAVAERNIARLEELIEDLRSGLTETEAGEVSLARVQSELIIAQADLETRQMMLAQALQQMEMARMEANRQTLYLSVGVFPIAPDAPAYPKAFENTALALLVFAGIYLLVSMTVSILREQVSS